MWKKNIYKTLTFTFILLSLTLVNIFKNPYTTLQKDNLYSREPNQNFLKIKYILEHKEKYDSFIFGSSRVGKINPVLFKNGKFYNMTYSEGLPYEHLINIKLFLKRHLKIKNIYIGLDDFSYEVEPYKHSQDTIYKPHYLASGESELSFYSLYANVSMGYIFKKRDKCYDIYNSGMPIVPKEEEDYIERHKIEHNTDKKFLEPCHHSGNRINQTIVELREIKSICDKHKINLIFFINPLHISTYMDTNFENFLLFKRKLADISPYFDFSGINKITTNNYFYYETSHYRVRTGNLIAQRINGYSNEDFGVYVTSKNIEAHIKQLRIDRLKWLAIYPKDISKIQALK